MNRADEAAAYSTAQRVDKRIFSPEGKKTNPVNSQKEEIAE